MKKFVFSFFIAFVAMGCAKNENEDTDVIIPVEAEYYTVSLSMKGDITITETPLSRAGESNDLYGINVYYDKEKDGNLNDIYGYGLFDNITDMAISLLTGYKYKFVCTLIKDGKDKLYYNATSSSSSNIYRSIGYLEPFGSYYSNNTTYTSYSGRPLGNEFILGGSFLNNLGSGLTYTTNGLRDYPTTDRYYGETTDYTPVKNGVVNIDMKRCVFGAKFIINGISDGTLYVTWPNFFSSRQFTSDAEIAEVIYTFSDVEECWINADAYSEKFTFTLSWKRSNGITQNLDPLKVAFKRNVLTTVTINLNGASNDASLGINEENVPMGTEDVNISIDADGVTENEIDPQG